MTGAGRPLRFLVTVLGCWTGMRAWQLWPTVDSLPGIARAIAAPLDRIAPVPMRPDPPAMPNPRGDVIAANGGPRPASPPPAPAASKSGRRVEEARPPLPDVRRIPLAQTTLLGFGDPVPKPADAAAATAHPSRLSGSAWMLLRGGPALAGGLAGAQLGGSQAGMRLAYAVDGARRLAITGRVSTAIGGSGAGRREGAVGLAWRPTRAPVTLVAEQRFVLDGGHGGPTLGAIAGIGPARVAAGFRIEAYGQAGAIARGGAGGGLEAFGDGAARLTRAVAIGPLHLDVGAGAWGGAQRGARRLDVGPTLGAALPVAGHGFRLALDWRARVAGDARPGSGPALSLGTDF